jgi:protein import protein ZIM17
VACFGSLQLGQTLTRQSELVFQRAPREEGRSYFYLKNRTESCIATVISGGWQLCSIILEAMQSRAMKASIWRTTLGHTGPASSRSLLSESIFLAQSSRNAYTRPGSNSHFSSLASTSSSCIPRSLTYSAHQSSSLSIQSCRFKSTTTSSASDLSSPEGASNTTTIPADDRFAQAAEEELLQAPRGGASQPLGKIDRRLSVTFTCTVPNCGHRSSHEFSRHAYEKGIVLCQCPQCDTRHLIGEHTTKKIIHPSVAQCTDASTADHLGWFDSDDLTQGGKYKTIEELLASKGEKVARAKINDDGTMEIEKNEEEP